MACFDGIAPTYHIELREKPTIVWDYHSLLLAVRMMLTFMSAAPAGRVNRRRLQESLCGYSFILPLVIGIGVFYLYGVVKVIIDSFYNVGAFNIRSFAGLSNYKALIADADVWSALLNTVLYVIIIVPATVILALILANLLNRNIKGRPFFRVVYFLPAVTMSTAVGMTPARIAGVGEKKGSLTVGKDADIVVMDADFQVKRVYVGGKQFKDQRTPRPQE